MFERLPYSRKFFVYICGFVIAAVGVFLIISSGISHLSNRPYVVYFDRSISGLKVGNQVFYKGVPVGFVNAISVEMPEAKRVKVVIKVSKNMLLYEGCSARISMQGLTGYCILELNNSESKTLLSGSMPEIISEFSMIETLFDRLPEMVANANDLIKTVRALVENNKHSISVSLGNLAKTVDSVNNTFVAIQEATNIVIRSGIRVEENVLPQIERTIGDLAKMVHNWSAFSEGTSLQLMELINNINNISISLNEKLNKNSGFLNWIL